MLCNKCRLRWAPIPSVRLTEEENTERKKVFDNDEVGYCGCTEEELGNEDYRFRWEGEE